MLGPFKFLIPKSLTIVAHKQVYDYIDLFVDKALEKIREEPADNPHTPMQKSLLEGLAKQTDDRIEIRQNVIQGMLAAQGTTYVLISNTLFLLSRNLSLYKRLREEVQDLDLKASPHLFDLLRDQEFIHNILRECKLLEPNSSDLNIRHMY
jgi:cytochrome P450